MTDERLAPDWTIAEPELDEITSCALCGLRTAAADVLEVGIVEGLPREVVICDDCSLQKERANDHPSGGDQGAA